MNLSFAVRATDVFRVALLTVATLLASAARTRAAEEPILPYLDDGTFIVGRLDVDRVDPAQLERLMNDVVKTAIKRMTADADADQQAKMKQEAAEATQKAKTWLADMKAAGARQVYGMFVNSDDLRRQSDDPYFIIPTADGADAANIGELMKQGLGGQWESETVGKALVIGKQVHFDRARAQVATGGPAKSIAAADVAAALGGAGGDAPVRLAILPGESTRAWIEENLPQLPPQVGGGDTKTVSRGIRWASVTVTQKPKIAADLKIQCTDATAAKALLDAINKGKAFVKEQVAAMPAAVGAEVAKQIEALQPKLAGDTLTMNMDAAAMMMFVPVRAEVDIDDAQPRPAPPAGAKPGKADDGGL